MYVSMYVCMFLHICTLQCVDLSIYLGLRATCDLWFGFVWFFHSTCISSRSLLHVLAQHRKKNQTCRFFINNYCANIHFISLIGVCSHDSQSLSLTLKLYYNITLLLRQEAYCPSKSSYFCTFHTFSLALIHI